jgi:apolipoprotein N-acyltransferase
MKLPMKRCIKFLDDHQYIFLIGSIVLMLVAYPFALSSSNPSLWVHILLSLILLTGLFAATTHDKFLKTSLFLGVFTFLFSWIDYALFEDSRMRLLYLVSGLLFFVFITVSLIRTIEKDKKVNNELIFGSIAGYMMIGLLSTFVFTIIQWFDPTAFSTTA